MIGPLKIGNVTLRNNLLLAPMAGYTDIAFRKLCLECGAGLATTEMISAKGLCYGNPHTEIMLRTDQTEYIKCIQLFGSDYRDFVKAHSLGYLKNFDIVDINYGCPVNKVLKNGDGSAMLHKKERAADIVKALSDLGCTVTVKMRIGIARDENIAVPFALEMEKAGASMITVHGRTTAQLYSGIADYTVVGQVRDAVSVPVALSGDITDKESFEQRENFADAYMIGRGALAKPAIFDQLQGKNERSKYSVLKAHMQYLEEFFDKRYCVNAMRRFLAYYLKGEKNMREFKVQINTVNNYDEIKEMIQKKLSGL